MREHAEGQVQGSPVRPGSPATTPSGVRLVEQRDGMKSPITLFTGQWADIPFAELAELASAWGSRADHEWQRGRAWR
jgi:hypothetical protein